ncbi:hypothetical protein ACYSNM_12745 [Myroides sp. LJL116]
MTEITLEQQYNIVLDKEPIKRARDGKFYYEVTGKDIITQRDTLLKLSNYRWYDGFYYYWGAGDTIVKEKESLMVEIHKMEVTHSMEWNCDDSLINGSPVSKVIKSSEFKELVKKHELKK